MVRRVVLAAVVTVFGVAFLIAPATAGSTVTKMRFELGGREITAGSETTGSVSLWAKNGSSWMPVAGATISVMADGEDMGTVVTDAAGFAVVSVPTDLGSGGHVMKVIFAGDGVHSRSQRAQGFSVTTSDAPATCTSVPSAPTLLVVDTTLWPTTGSVMVVWAPPTNDGGCPITGYNVSRGPDLAGSASGSATSYVDTTAPGGMHEYFVTAVNDAGQSLPSNGIFVSL